MLNKKEMLPQSGLINREQKLSSNTFNIRLALDDSSSFSEITEIYHNPFLTEGCSTLRETFYTNTGFKLNDFENISIDKFSILFDCPALNSNSFYVKQYWDRFEQMLESRNLIVFGSNSLYKHHCNWCFHYDIQWGVVQTKYPTIKIEFNPNKADLENLIAFFSCMKKQTFNTSRAGRLDIAIDYGIYLEPYCWSAKNTPIDNLHRKKCSYSDFLFWL